MYKKIGFVILVLIIIALYLLVGQMGKEIGKKHAKNNFTQSVNKNLPKMIDEFTRLDTIIDKSNSIEYKYTILINDVIPSSTINELNATLRIQICQNELLSNINKEKAFIYTYKNELETSQHSISIEKYFCQNRSNQSLKQECENNNSDSCMNIAKGYESNGSLEIANDFYQKACDLDNGIACFILATHIKDLSKVAKYKRSCELGVADGCTTYGLLLYEGGTDIESIKFLELGCQKNSLTGCRAAGNFYIKNKNIFKANDNYKYGCEIGDGYSCNQMGIHYAKGKGVKKDIEKARNYFGLACDNKSESGCTNYANMGVNWEYRSSSRLYILPKLIKGID